MKKKIAILLWIAGIASLAQAMPQPKAPSLDDLVVMIENKLQENVDSYDRIARADWISQVLSLIERIEMLNRPLGREYRRKRSALISSLGTPPDRTYDRSKMEFEYTGNYPALDRLAAENIDGILWYYALQEWIANAYRSINEIIPARDRDARKYYRDVMHNKGQKQLIAIADYWLTQEPPYVANEDQYMEWYNYAALVISSIADLKLRNYYAQIVQNMLAQYNKAQRG